MDRKPLIYQFDDVRVDLEQFEVIKGDSRARLEPKAFETLIFLIGHRGRLVEKRELLDAVWKDAFVTENAMTRVIAQLRKALGDDSKQAKYIETAPTRGYRFIADVKLTHRQDAGPKREAIETTAPADQKPLRREPERIWWIAKPQIAIATVVIVLVAFLPAWLFYRNARVRWAREKAIPEITRLITEDNYTAAVTLGRQAEKHIPDDPALTSSIT